MNHVLSGFDDEFTCRIIWSIKLHELHKGLVFNAVLSCPHHHHQLMFMFRNLSVSVSFQLEPGQLLSQTLTPTHSPLPKSRCFHRGHQRSQQHDKVLHGIKKPIHSRTMQNCTCPCADALCHKSGGAESLRHV